MNILLFNMRTYGAKGDGVTDDTAGVNNAIAAAIKAGTATGNPLPTEFMTYVEEYQWRNSQIFFF
jgi:hypothetical protein